METLFWENNDINNFNIFMRDLSVSVSKNLKHMIEDLDKDENNKDIKSKKPKKPKKKDLIIQEQNKLRKNKLIEEDKKICEFLIKNLDDKNPYISFDKLKTNDGKLEFRKTKNENESTPDFKVTLGVVPDYLFTGEGMRLDGISEDKPAQRAGMQKGDIVVKMGEHEVTDMMSFMKSLSMFEKGQTTMVTIDRGGELMELEVTF